jgi:lysophospholipase L1-like esterase
MADYALKLFSPNDVYNRQEGVIQNWDDFPIRFLAQGDSWFSVGAMPPWSTSNILQEIVLGFAASAINCAYPGRRLAHMVEWQRDTGFSKLLAGKFAFKWDGILLSGGGNDLISAASVLPYHPDGAPVGPESRLLLKQSEWGPSAQGAARYISDQGWATFAAHLPAQFEGVIAQRDTDINRNVPLFCHTYDYMLPRNAPASARLRMGPWLYPAFVAYQIPPADWLATVIELLKRLASLLRSVVDDLNAGHDRRIYLIDSRDTLVVAEPGTKKVSNDWENEIHPTPGGYRKLAAHWRPVIEAQVQTGP